MSMAWLWPWQAPSEPVEEVKPRPEVVREVDDMERQRQDMERRARFIDARVDALRPEDNRA